jgi:hypothetical protein
MEQWSDPDPGKTIPDPQHCLGSRFPNQEPNSLNPDPKGSGSPALKQNVIISITQIQHINPAPVKTPDRKNLGSF